jgi:Holliday junction resolvase RusA-like endonuclease
VTAPEELAFVVPGHPVPKARARIVRSAERGAKPRAFTPARSSAWEGRVALMARAAASRSGWRASSDRCCVEIVLAGLSALADVDNAAKSILDGCNGITWDDDRRVVALAVWRAEALGALRASGWAWRGLVWPVGVEEGALVRVARLRA